MTDFTKIASENNLRALAVVGSRARGDFSQYSDLDLIGLSEKNDYRRFWEDGIFVELRIFREVSEWQSKPYWWYGLDSLKVEIDDGTLATLPALIASWRQQYSPDLDEVKRNREWLEGVVRKLRASTSDVAAMYVVSVNLWGILSGAFIARNMPFPNSSDMFRLAPQIVGKERFESLLTGTIEERRAVALDMCSEIIEAHNKRLCSPDDGRP